MEPSVIRCSQRPTATRDVVVVVVDGFSASAHVARTENDSVRLVTSATSDAADVYAAARHALTALTATHGKLPRRAIVVTPEVTQAVLQLPAAVAERSERDVHEMLRWEIEPHVAQRAGSRPIGSLLVQRGVLAADQVLDMLEEQRRIVPGPQRGRRFGAIAVERGLADNQQVNDAAWLQDWFLAEDGRPVTGWTWPDGASCIAVSVPEKRRERWTNVLRDHGLALDGLYPLFGAVAASLGSTGDVTVLQVERGAIVLSTQRDAQIDALDVIYPGEQDVSADLLADALMGYGGDVVHVASRNGRAVEFTAGLAERGHPALAVDAPHACALGAARHALRSDAPGLIACVPARDPAPPMRERRRFPFIAAATLALVLLCAGEAWVQWHLGGARDAALGAESALLQSERTNDAINAAARKVTEFRERQGTLDVALGKARERVTLLRDEVPVRQRALPGLLDALARLTDGEVALTRVRSRGDGAAELEGWALTAGAAERYGRALAAWGAAVGVGVAEQAAWADDGRLGVAGYAFRIRLEREQEPSQ